MRALRNYWLFAGLIAGFCTSAEGSAVRDFDIETGRLSSNEFESKSFNEAISTYNGAITWRHTDVNIPGNGGFDLNVTRVYNSVQPRQYPKVPTPYGFGWTVSFGRVIAPDGNSIDKVCSQTLWSVSSADNPSIEFSDGSRELLLLSSEFNDGSLITASNWRMQCVDGMPVVYSPSGQTIVMGHRYFHPDEPGWMATYIEDIYGQYIEVGYGDSSGVPYIKTAKRFSLDGEEEASVEFKYKNLGSSSIELEELIAIGGTEPPRVHTYEYEAYDDFDESLGLPKKLVRVDRPDDKHWEYDYYDRVEDPNPNDDIKQDGAGSYSIKSVTYPYGGTVEYTYQLVQLQPATTLLSYPYVAAVYQKTVTDPISGQSGTWTYDFSPGASRVAAMFVNTGNDVLGPLDVLTITPPSIEYPKIAYHHYSAYRNAGGRWVPSMIGLLNRRLYIGQEGDSKDKVIAFDQYQHSSGRKISSENHYLKSLDYVSEGYFSAHITVLASSRGIGDFNEESRMYISPHSRKIVQRDRWGREVKVVETYGGEGIKDVRGKSPKNLHIDQSHYLTTYNKYQNIDASADGKWFVGGVEYSEVAESDGVGNYSIGNILSYDIQTRDPATGAVLFHLDEGNNWDYAYYPEGELKSVSRHERRVKSLFPPIAGVSLAETMQVQRDASYLVIHVANGWGEIYEEYSPQFNITRYQYDGMGRVEYIDKPLGANIAINYGGNQVVTTRGGIVITESLDGFGNLTERKVSGAGSIITKKFEYDLLGRLTFESQENSELGKRLSYDHLSRVREAILPTMQYRYSYPGTDEMVELAFGKNEDGSVEYTSSNITRNAMIGVNWSEKILVEKYTDRISIKFSSSPRSVGYARDGLGRLDQVIPFTTSTSGSKLIEGNFPDHMPAFTYDDLGRLKTTYSPEEGARCYEYKYGDLNKMFEGLECGDDANDKVFDYNHDYQGRLIGKFDIRNHIYTSWKYDEDRLLRTSVRNLFAPKVIKEYGYDENNNLTSETLIPGAAGLEEPFRSDVNYRPNSTSQFGQINLNRKYELIYDYDELDNLTAITYPDGMTVNYETDDLGRPTQAGGYVSNVEYHADGLLKDIEYGNGVIKHVEYDDLDRPDFLSVKKNQQDYIDLEQGFSLEGLLWKKTERSTPNILRVDEDGTFFYSYDNAQNLTRYRFQEPASSNITIDGEYEYNAAYDPIVSTNHYLYDESKRLKSIRGVGAQERSYPDRVDSFLAYRYNELGHMTSRVFEKTKEPSVTESTAWLTKQTFFTSVGGSLMAMINSEDAQGGGFKEDIHAYTYGADSWRVTDLKKSYTRSASGASLFLLPKLSIEFYNKGGKLLFSEKIQGCNITKSSYVYIGNELVAERKTSGYSDYLDLNANSFNDCHDQEVFGASTSTLDVNLWSPYLLKGLMQPSIQPPKNMQREQEAKNPVVIKAAMGLPLFLMFFIYSGLAFLKRFKGAAKRLGFILACLIAPTAYAQITEEVTYFHGNLQGDVSAATDDEGNLLYRQQYAPYGKALKNTGQPLGFRGHQYSEDTYLIYMGARYMDPMVGRFITPDPLSQFSSIEANPMMINRYAYGNNNPLNYTDPDGRYPVDLHQQEGQIIANVLTNGDTSDAALGQFLVNFAKGYATAVGTAAAVEAGGAVGGRLLGAAASRVAGSIRNVNKVAGKQNCVNCSVATDATLAGRPTSALNTNGPLSISVLERHFGAKFGTAMTSSSIESSILQAGNGARGIVFGSRGNQTGHVFNVINQNGVVRFLDGQTGKAANVAGFQNLHLLRTN